MQNMFPFQSMLAPEMHRRAVGYVFQERKGNKNPSCGCPEQPQDDFVHAEHDRRARYHAQ
jgi:hypothetical protein